MDRWDVEITQKELHEIVGEKWKDYEKLLDNCYCGCDRDNHITTIVEYKVFVNDMYDIVLRGHCKKCGWPLYNTELAVSARNMYTAV